MNELSLRKFAPEVAPHGLILYNSERLPHDFEAPQANVICIPAQEIADKLGSAKAANIVLLGALLEDTDCFSPQTAASVIQEKVREAGFVEINRMALQAGREFIDQQVWTVPESQPDGFA